MAQIEFISPAKRSCVQRGGGCWHEGEEAWGGWPSLLLHAPVLQGIRVCSMLEGGLTPVHTFDSCRDMGFNLVLRPVTGGPIL